MSDGAGRVYKRGNVWWIDYSFRGKRHRESSESQKKSIATKLLRKRMAEMASGKLVGPDEERMTFEGLADIIEDDYVVNGRRSLDRMLLSFKHLRGYFGQVRALDISADRLLAYVRARQEEGAANASIRKELAALKRAFSLARKAERLTRVPPFPTIDVDNVRKDFLTGGDVEAICAELDEDLAPVVRFAFLTGWRKREILSLRWRQVDWTAGEVRLEAGTTKNREARTFPFAALPPLDALLRSQRDRTRAVERDTGAVVPWVFHRGGDRIRSMHGAWLGATKRAGLTGAWFHDLRRSAVRNMERAGVSRSVAMSFSGHKTESVYNRYAIADKDAQREGAAKLAALHEEDATVTPIRKAEGA